MGHSVKCAATLLMHMMCAGLLQSGYLQLMWRVGMTKPIWSLTMCRCP